MVDVVVEHPDGRIERVRKVSPVQTKRDAEAYERELKRAILAGTRGRPQVTVAELAERFMGEHATRLKPSTRALYRDQLDRLVVPALGRLDVAALTRGDVEALHRSIGAKHPTTANRVLQLVSAMLTKAEHWGLRPQNSHPCVGIQRFKEEAKERFLSADERQALDHVLEQAAAKRRGEPGYVSPGFVLLVRLLLATGARKGEIAGLAWGMVDLEGGALNLPDSKTGKKRIVLSPQAVELLRAARPAHASKSALVCASERGSQLSNIERAWQTIRERAGLDGVRLHDLRHSAASDAIAAGVPIAIVGGLLGHRSTRTTARYAHLAEDALKAGAATMGTAIAKRSRKASKR